MKRITPKQAKALIDLIGSHGLSFGSNHPEHAKTLEKALEALEDIYFTDLEKKRSK